MGRTIRVGVIGINGAWRLVIDGEVLGRFKTRADAVLCATRIIDDTSRTGQVVELLVQEPFGELRQLDPEQIRASAAFACENNLV